LEYRASSLSKDERARPGKVRAGDRAPDALCEDSSGAPTRIFDALRGPHFSVLAFGGIAQEAKSTCARWGDAVRFTHVSREREKGALADPSGHAHASYGAYPGAVVIVRPDGYIGLWTDRGPSSLESYLDNVLGKPMRSVPRGASFEKS